jgi:RNA polymerase sigma-70 factor (ECF subfamily)
MEAATNQQQPELDFSWFYTSHEPFVRSIVRCFRFTDAAADDLVQEIFFKAWKGLKSLEQPAALSGWVKAIARNECATVLKQQKKSQHRIVPLDSVSCNIESPGENTLFDLSLSQFEEHVAILHDILKNHENPLRREVATLFYTHNKSISEISQLLDMKQNTVLSHLRRFRLIAANAMHRWMIEQG